MSTRERPADRGRRLARASIVRLGADGRDTRVAAGLSTRVVAAATGVSHTHVVRFEGGRVAHPRIEFLGAYCAVIGLELHLRAYPSGDPLRDRGQRAVLERLRGQLHSTLRWRTEVPFPIAGDLRAWDAEIRPPDGDWRVRVEAETKVTDGQALERRLALKIRDGGDGHVLLLVADTRANRDAMAGLRPGLRELLPLDSRAMLTALRAGRDPGGNGIVIL